MRSDKTDQMWVRIGRSWADAGRLWEAQDAYERAGRELTAEELTSIADRCLKAGRFDEAEAAHQLVGRLRGVRMPWTTVVIASLVEVRQAVA